MSSSVPRYSNTTTALTTASSATSPAAANNALKRHNSFTLTSTATNHGQHHHHDYRDQDNDDNDDDDGECNDLIPPRPPDVQEGMHSNELPKRLTSYELMPPVIKPSSSMPNDLPNTKYLHKANSSAGAGEHTSDDGGDSQYHGSQSNILMPRPPYRSHSRSTSKSYNVSNSNLTTTTTLASSTLSNLSTNSGIMSRSTGRNMISSGGGGGGGGGYVLNSYSSNSNNGGGPLGSRYAHARTQQNIEPRTTPYYYHELMQKSAVFDSDLNLLTEINQADNGNINSANGDEIGSSSPPAAAGHNVGSQQQQQPPLYHQHHLSSLNGSLDNVLEATRKDLNDLILGNSLLYNQSHSSNDLLNNNANGNSSSAGTLVDHDHDHDDDDEQQHHSLGYSINTSTNSHQNPIPAVRNISNSNSSSSAYLKRSSQHHSLHASNSNILNSNNSNSNNHHHHHSSSYHHLNHPNEKYVA